MLQTAIDAVHSAMVNTAIEDDVSQIGQGIVYAMPGLYGNHLTNPGGMQVGSGDVLPIFMRDRVHVQGSGARQCILRGNPTEQGPLVLRPCFAAAPQSEPHYFSTHTFARLLVSYELSSQYATWLYAFMPIDLPWRCTGETAEVFDGFTFQGGDVQVLISDILMSWPLSARISNCIFDLRHCIDPGVAGLPKVEGATIGLQISPILIPRQFVDPPNTYAYHEFKVHVLNNTFIFWDGTQETKALAPAIGILDVCDPWSYYAPFDVDPIAMNSVVGDEFRSMSRIGVQNNLFRTPPDTWSPELGTLPLYAAMVGVGLDDTLVGAGQFQTNAFAPGRATNRVGQISGPQGGSQGSGCQVDPSYGSGCSSGLGLASFPWPRSAEPVGSVNFQSGGCPEPVWYPSGIIFTLPIVPAVALWNGNTTGGQEVDPAFVGESLFEVGASVPSTYVDFRLLPGSPLMEQGKIFPINLFANGERYLESSCPSINFMDWDGEGHGNPRIAGTVDIGFDEVGLFVMAGSYGNYTNSHNDPPKNSSGAPILDLAATQGQQARYGIFPKFVPGTMLSLQNTYTFELFATDQIPLPVNVGSGWVVPPAAAANPIVDTGAVSGFDKQWITLDPNNLPAAVAGWPGVAQPMPPSGVQIQTDSVRHFASGLGNPPTGQPDISFLMISQNTPWIVDAENSPYAAWFNTQFRIYDANSPSTPYYLSNLQAEYR